MIRRPPRSTLDRSSAASDVYKRQVLYTRAARLFDELQVAHGDGSFARRLAQLAKLDPVSYTHLRAHATVLDLVCRLLLEKKKNTITKENIPVKVRSSSTYHVICK